MKLGVKFGWAKDEEIVMPKELKERVLETVKKYVEEKEKELEKYRRVRKMKKIIGILLISAILCMTGCQSVARNFGGDITLN